MKICLLIKLVRLLLSSTRILPLELSVRDNFGPIQVSRGGMLPISLPQGKGQSFQAIISHLLPEVLPADPQ